MLEEKKRKGVGRQKTEGSRETRSLGKEERFGHKSGRRRPLLFLAVERDHLFPGGRPMYHKKPRAVGRAGAGSAKCRKYKYDEMMRAA